VREVICGQAHQGACSAVEEDDEDDAVVRGGGGEQTVDSHCPREPTTVGDARWVAQN
jgi:hypothetical protein